MGLYSLNRHGIVLVVGTAAFALLAAACGSSKATKATDTTKAATGNTTVAASGGSPEVAKAKAAVEAAMAAPTKIGVDKPLTGKVKADQTYVFLECELPQCKAIGDGAIEAAKAIGWKTQVINWKTSDPSTLIAALKQALDYKPVAVTPTGFPQEFWGTIIPDYEKAGTMIVPAAVATLTLSKTVPGGASIASDYKTSGNAIGNWAIMDSNAEAHVLVQDVPAYEVLKNAADGMRETIKAGCAKCVVTSLDVTVPQLTEGTLVQAVVDALKKDPSIKYVLSSDGAFLGGLDAALKAANLTGIKVAGAEPAITNKQNLVTGSEHAWSDEPISQTGWQIIDIAARASLGMEVPAGDGGRPQRLLTKANVGTPGESLDLPANFKDLYKKLWGVA